MPQVSLDQSNLAQTTGIAVVTVAALALFSSVAAYLLGRRYFGK